MQYNVVIDGLVEAAGTIQLRGSTLIPTVAIHLRKSTVIHRDPMMSWPPSNCAPPLTAATHPTNLDTSITVRHLHTFRLLDLSFHVVFATDFGPLTYGDDDLLPADVKCALRSVQFIAKHTKETDRDIEVFINSFLLLIYLLCFSLFFFCFIFVLFFFFILKSVSQCTWC